MVCHGFYIIYQGYDGSVTDSLKIDRYCGQALGACADSTCSALNLGPVRTSVLPFTLGVVTDGDETPDGSNKGFRLFYKQQPCQ